MSTEIPPPQRGQPKKAPPQLTGLQKSTQNTVLKKLGTYAEGCAFGSFVWSTLDRMHEYDHRVSTLVFVTSTCVLAVITGIELLQRKK